MNAIEVELMWSALRSAVTEQAKAMQRTAFSPVVRDAGDLAYALFDARGRIVAQADTGTPGHINCLANTGEYLANLFKGQIQDGDVLITNDPWHGAGHLFDITIIMPVYRHGSLVGYVGSTNHHADIGGLGVGVGANDVHEEGLWIPPAKLFEAGKQNELLYDVIRHNVRLPEYVEGDLAAQVASAREGAVAMNELCDRFGLDNIEALSDEIIERSEAAMRAAIRECRPGTFFGESIVDFGSDDGITLKAAVTVDPEKGEILVDFTGSSPQVNRGINVVLNYTHAYTTFAVRSCLSANLPNNAGSLAPIKVKAPEGCIVNCRYPAPVAARHVVGMFVPMPILKALFQVIPERVLAQGCGAPFAVQVIGENGDGRQFISTQFAFSGGMGARAKKPGPSATCYPTGIGATPIEVLEVETPVFFRRRELRHGSGGLGRSRGGDGQIVEFTVQTERPWTLNAVPVATRIAPDGVDGGHAGATGSITVNGQPWTSSGKTRMNPGDVVHMETPGGGGYGQPE